MGRSIKADTPAINSTNTNTTDAVIVSGNTSVKSRRKYLLPGLITLLIAIIFIGGIVYLHSRQKHSPQVGACVAYQNGALLKEGGPDIINNSIGKQTQLVTKIKSLPNYVQDPNCMYVLTMYAVNRGDVQSAKLYDKQLDSAYAEKRDLSPLLGGVISVKDVDHTVTTLSNSIQHYQNGLDVHDPFIK
ncbi:MAG TPA: hypothetical protein VFN56_02500 [Candidatus Saccharimonadales bacterium]|nr:hypothetical protein [Candidatus Saccharimonadales bacterium]